MNDIIFWFAICTFCWIYVIFTVMEWIIDYRDKKRDEKWEREFHEKHKNDPPSQGSSIAWPLSYQVDDDRLGRIPKG